MLRPFVLLALLAAPLSAASLDAVDTSVYLVNIGGTAGGSQGSIVLDPAGVAGYANFGGATFTPTHSGGAVGITLAAIGSFTPSALGNLRFSDSVGGVLDTNAVRGSTAVNTGYRLSLVPGVPGTYVMTIHAADFGVDVNYAVKINGAAVGATGALPNSSAYDEGVIVFRFTVANATEAAATWTFDLTHVSATDNPLAIASAVLVPYVPPVPLLGLGRLVCIGDSITEGNASRPAGEGNWSWRYWCWQNFIDFGTVHEFVGTRTANQGGSSVYPSYSGQTFVNRHEAIWGTTFLERSNSAATYLGSLKASGKTPDTAVIFGGGNDIPLDLSVTAATVRDRTKLIVDRLQGDLGTAGNPKIRILLVSILPRFSGSPATTPDVRNNRYAEINALLGTLATAETTATSEVMFLDVFPLFNNPARFWDGVHPNGSGEQLLGNAIFAKLVPDLPAVQLKLVSRNDATRTLVFNVRTHGPRPVKITASTDLAPLSWSDLVPQALNPGAWTTVTHIHPSTLPPRWFFRAVAE